jgi:hypothetical protein
MMASTTTQTTALAAFTLPGSPHSARMARFYVRAALAYHGLGGYADDAEAVASELIANAGTHTPAPVVTLALTWLESIRGLGIVVTDPSPLPPVKRAPGKDTELPRVFRTGNLRLIHAASCPFRYSSRTSCGVR